MTDHERIVSIGTLDALRATISFLTSVIRCGEPMTPEVQQAIDNAHTRIDKIIAGPRPSTSPELDAHIRQQDTASGAPKRSGWF